MNKEEYINSVVSHVKSKRNKQFISKEIGDHIDDGIEFYQSKGYDYETACEKAVSSMGDAHLVGAQLGKLHSGYGLEIFSVIALLVIYVILYVIFAFLVLLWISSFSLWAVIAELLVLFLSVLSVIVANKLKSLPILLVSFTFIFIYFIVNFFVLTQFSPLLTADYFLLSFNAADFVNLVRSENRVLNIGLPLASVLFYLIWFSAYGFSFYNIFTFIKCRYNLKSVKRENKFNKILMAVLIFQIFTVSLLTYTAMSKNVSSLVGDDTPYYEEVIILDSDTPCDMKTLYDSIDFYPASISLSYDWTYKDCYYYELVEPECIQEWKKYNSCFEYRDNTLYGKYETDKRYITVVPVRLEWTDYGETIIPDFDKAQWYETSSTFEISGELDISGLKSYYHYKIDVINENA